jgi:MFS family permease
MVEKVQKILSESKTARWTALLIVSFTMFAGYYLADVLAPLKGLLEGQLTWDSSEYGFVTGAYGWFNVFLFFLIIGGIILDKKGARFSGKMSTMLMVGGTMIKYWAISTHSLDGIIWSLPIFGIVKAQVMTAALGYAIFAVGVEVAGITVSKIIVKWFKGHEMALAMGMQLAIARLGTALALSTSLPIALSFNNVSAPVLVCLIMLCIGMVTFFIYCLRDKKLDVQIAADNAEKNIAPEEAFRIKDILSIIKNKGWWYIAILCVLFYSAVFPFLKYATELMIQKFHITEYWAGTIPALLPFGTILLTPLFGNMYDRRGKGASIMILGSLIIILVHVLFSIPFLDHWIIAILLVPSAMWPSVPKVVPERQLGTAFSLIFWVQNWGLMGVPILIGWVVEKYCFIGYFSLVGTGFIINQGDQVTKVVTQDKKVFELKEVGILSRVDTVYQVTNVDFASSGKISSVTTSVNDTISSAYFSPQTLVVTDENSLEIEVPKYTYGKNGTVVGFVDSKNQPLPKFHKVRSFYNYTLPMMIFAGFGLLAIIFAFLLKIEDKKKGYGLESPNIKK